MDEFSNKIKGLIDSKTEGDYWDFKQKWHGNTQELIHDILCFANTAHHLDCYIIFGISDDFDFVTLESANRRKQSDIVGCLNNTYFAGDNIPEISVKTITIEGNFIDVLIIHNSYNTPFYIKQCNKKQYKLKAGFVYSRCKDRNTPIDQNASVWQIELLWKKRFGLTQPALKQTEKLLECKSNWQQYDESYYYIYDTDFVIVEETDYNLDGKEFYVYTQYNPNIVYQTTRIMNKTTILEEFQVILLDSAVFMTPVPLWSYLHFSNPSIEADISYKYYLKDSLRYKLQLFYEDHSSFEAQFAKKKFDEVVIYYNNEREKSDFEKYILENKDMYYEYYEEIKNNKNYYMDGENTRTKAIYSKRLNDGIVLNKMLLEVDETWNS